MPEPFPTAASKAVRITISVLIGAAGLVFGVLATRDLGLPWALSLLLGAFACGLGAWLGWRSPESFFKNRP